MTTVYRRLRARLSPFAFIGSVILGALGIFVSKYFAWPTWLVVAVPLSVMAAYLIASLKLPRLATRQDQIGDNVYYLGFLLTLVSLTVTLIQYSSDSANEYIISNFGVALAATIAGIAARSVVPIQEGYRRGRESCSVSLVRPHINFEGK